MSNYKGTNIHNLHKIFQQKDPALEEKLIQKLSPEDAKLFQFVVPVQWVPVEAAARILAAASRLVFPKDTEYDASYSLSCLQAKENLSGIYRFILSVVTPMFAVSQGARFWSTVHDTGKGHEEVTGPKSAKMVVENYPGLPKLFYPHVGGYMKGVIEFTHAKNFHVTFDGSNLNRLVWDANWE